MGGNYQLDLTGTGQLELSLAIMQISVQIGLNWNLPPGTELGKNDIE